MWICALRFRNICRLLLQFTHILRPGCASFRISSTPSFVVEKTLLALSLLRGWASTVIIAIFVNVQRLYTKYLVAWLKFVCQNICVQICLLKEDEQILLKTREDLVDDYGGCLKCLSKIPKLASFRGGLSFGSSGSVSSSASGLKLASIWDPLKSSSAERQLSDCLNTHR